MCIRDRGRPGPLDKLLPALAEKYHKSELQILLRWVTQNGVVVITTSAQQARVKESVNIFDFELTAEDFDSITKIGREKIFRGFMGEQYSKYDDTLYKDLD